MTAMKCLNLGTSNLLLSRNKGDTKGIVTIIIRLCHFAAAA